MADWLCLHLRLLSALAAIVSGSSTHGSGSTTGALRGLQVPAQLGPDAETLHDPTVLLLATE